MRTIESVVKELYKRQHNMDSLCGYDHGQPPGLMAPNTPWADSPLRCTFGAAWHLMVGAPPNHYMLQACDRHLAMCQLACRETGEAPSLHEFAGACGLPGTFWLADYNACASQETMWELGLLYTVESAIKHEEDSNRCVCNCPSCKTWIHLTGECDRAIDMLGYTHTQYAKLTMGVEVN